MSQHDAPIRSYHIPQHLVLVLLFLAAYYVFEFGINAGLASDPGSYWHAYLPFLKKLSLSLCAIIAILLAGKIIERLIDSSDHSEGVRYNLVQLTRLVSFALIAIIIIAFLFQNLYAAAVSFGLISLVLGFALQAPITSFIAWLYIVLRRPYHVGDRIQLGELKGDVIEIGYLDTTIREFSGIYLGNDRPSGRIIRFPNSVLLKSEIINYSGPFKPFIWNETAIQIAYTSDLEFVEHCLVQAADDDLRERHPEHAEIPENHATVYFRANSYAWLEAVVSYPVEPTDTTGRRNRILRRALPWLNAEPDKVQFPQGTTR